MKRKINLLLRSFVDIRPGEGRKTALVFVYYLLVIFAYYILKPVARGLFLDEFDPDKLPYLYILMALLGGTGASWISRAAARSRLTSVIGKAQIFLLSNILIIWWLLQFQSPAVLYVFSVWVGTFSVMTVGQFWLLANNLFDTRSARRLFSLIGVAAVIGGISGGTFTSVMVEALGARHLMLASGTLVGITWLVVRALRKYETAYKRAAEEEPEKPRFKDSVRLVWNWGHLRGVAVLVSLMFIVDTLVDYQFSVIAKQTYQKTELVAFLARFQGIYLNLLSFSFQLLLTRPILRHVGVGGVLGFAPFAVAAGSAFFLAVPSMLSVGLTRALEAATRYTFTRTGMEILYLPVPPHLKNRTKIFLDVSVDRISRATAGGLLLLCTAVLAVRLQVITALTLVFVAIWITVVVYLLRSYVRILRKSIEKREFHLEHLTVNPSDHATVGVLLRALDSPNERPAVYALEVLEQLPPVPLGNRPLRLLQHDSPQVRAGALRLLASWRDASVAAPAYRFLNDHNEQVRTAAAHYISQCDPNPTAKLQGLLRHADAKVRLAAISAAAEASYPRPLPGVTPEWIQELMNASGSEVEIARLTAARAIPLADLQSVPVNEHLHKLLANSDPTIVNAALQSAAVVRASELLPDLIACLGRRTTRGEARQALRSYGPAILDALRERLDDPQETASIRRRIPRILGDLATPESAEVLAARLPHSALEMRFQILKALNRIRRDHPTLPIPGDVIDAELLQEAKRYYQLLLSIETDREREGASRTLLIRSLQERLDQTLERIFRLLGLRYHPDEIYDAYRAISTPGCPRRAAALELLDSTLSQPLKNMILPILEESSWEHLEPLGKTFFGIEPSSAEDSLRRLIQGDDNWLKIVALYRASDLNFWSLEPEIRAAESDADLHVVETAMQALSRMAQQNSEGRVA